ncbi:MAG: hypothetical protein ACJASQ_003371 [Crocinitomicaceae bacterium]|jgi:hypothetical protein
MILTERFCGAKLKTSIGSAIVAVYRSKADQFNEKDSVVG